MKSGNPLMAICASFLAAQKLATVPRNSPAYVAAVADAVIDAKKMLSESRKTNEFDILMGSDISVYRQSEGRL
jgi:hypothetical protein